MTSISGYYDCGPYCDGYYSETKYGLLVESTVGYLVGRTSNFLFRIEGNFGALIHEGSIDGGAHLILGIGD